MKIYICVTPFFPTDNSFRGAFIYDQIKAIQQTGIYDQVFVFHPTALLCCQREYTFQGIKVHLFPSIQMPSYILNGLSNGFNDRMFIRRVKQAGINIKDICIVHGHTSTFASYGLALKKINSQIKTLIQHHDLDPFTIRNGRWAEKKWNTRYRALKNIALFNQVDCHVSVSRFVEDSLLSFPRPSKNDIYNSYIQRLEHVSDLSPIRPKNSIVLYNGVDTTQFYPREVIQEKAFFKIGCIGNFVELKDQITLIKAFEILRNNGYDKLRLSFIGSGPLKQFCMDYVAKHDLSSAVTFEPEVAHSQLPDYYRSLDLFVLPSFYEGFGCVYTEAFACGVPFMACEHQGATECIESSEKHKWLFRPHDHAQLARLIESYINNPSKQYLCVSYDINTLIQDFFNRIAIL